jgi:2-polyprenyl-3-methyl-5-hydroxy-6-metoxy-1,4-benzoquinol methylase
MDQDKIWNYFQNEAPEILNKAEGRLKFIADQVERRRGTKAKVLNVGVGSGLFEESAIKRGLDIYSLDPSEGAINRLGDQLGLQGKAQVGHLQLIPFDNEMFDAVVASEVLEHLSDEALETALSEIHRVLARGGLLIGTVPAREDLSEQFVVCPHCGEKFHRWGHLQSFDAARMRGLLSKRFQVEEIAERYFDAWSRLNWKGKALSVTKQALLRLGINGSGNSLYFAAVKR